MAAPISPISIGAPASLVAPQPAASNTIQSSSNGEPSQPFKQHLNNASDKQHNVRNSAQSKPNQEDKAVSNQVVKEKNVPTKSASSLSAADTNKAKAAQAAESTAQDQQVVSEKLPKEEVIHNTDHKESSVPNSAGTGKELPLEGKGLPQGVIVSNTEQNSIPNTDKQVTSLLEEAELPKPELPKGTVEALKTPNQQANLATNKQVVSEQQNGQFQNTDPQVGVSKPVDQIPGVQAQQIPSAVQQTSLAKDATTNNAVDSVSVKPNDLTVPQSDNKLSPEINTKADEGTAKVADLKTPVATTSVAQSTPPQTPVSEVKIEPQIVAPVEQNNEVWVAAVKGANQSDPVIPPTNTVSESKSSASSSSNLATPNVVSQASDKSTSENISVSSPSNLATSNIVSQASDKSASENISVSSPSNLATPNVVSQASDKSTSENISVKETADLPKVSEKLSVQKQAVNAGNMAGELKDSGEVKQVTPQGVISNNISTQASSVYSSEQSLANNESRLNTAVTAAADQKAATADVSTAASQAANNQGNQPIKESLLASAVKSTLDPVSAEKVQGSTPTLVPANNPAPNTANVGQSQINVAESATPILDKSLALNQSLEKMRAGIESSNFKDETTETAQSKHAATRVASSVEGLQQLTSLQNSMRTTAPVQMQMPPGTPPTSKNWGRAVADKVYIAASQNLRVANIQLDPPELGALQVRLQVTGPDQQMSVSFTSPHASVRDTLEQQLPKLREMLEEQGINLGESSVNDQRENSQQMAGDGEQNASGAYADGADPENPVNPLNTQGTLALVDFYA